MNLILNKFQETVWRVKIATLAFIQAPSYEPVIKLKNGAYLDLGRKKIVLPNDTHIHCDGNLKLTSDKHIVIRSGRDADPEREGILHSVWTNCDEDELGRPVKKEEKKTCGRPNCECVCKLKN